MEDANLNYAESNRVSILTVDKFSRRMVLQFMGINHMLCYASPALAAPIMPDMKEPEVIRFVCLFSIFLLRSLIFLKWKVLVYCEMESVSVSSFQIRYC